ncbi:hypothetical protein HYDPIDRAFT_44533 [Hydnomerulius pinastri MD-312]|uniref:Uncharacterized protein n=1 Tax=Hydnomerulius pinastri MD-312 TaxID=994086 RepID=A0A0C9W7C3_9AGAM|nr:hypothetical protein HYDPIDRAFT_44533 [Hydnomerulius pinastri MD-312]
MESEQGKALLASLTVDDTVGAHIVVTAGTLADQEIVVDSEGNGRDCEREASEANPGAGNSSPGTRNANLKVLNGEVAQSNRSVIVESTPSDDLPTSLTAEDTTGTSVMSTDRMLKDHVEQSRIAQTLPGEGVLIGIRERVEKAVALQWVSGTKNVADVFTKALPPQISNCYVDKRVGGFKGAIGALAERTVDGVIEEAPKLPPESRSSRGRADQNQRSSAVVQELVATPQVVALVTGAVDTIGNVAVEVQTLGTTWGVLLDRIKLFAKIADGIAEIHPLVSLVWSVLPAVNKVIINQQGRDDGTVSLAGTMNDAFAFVHDAEPLNAVTAHLTTPETRSGTQLRETSGAHKNDLLEGVFRRNMDGMNDKIDRVLSKIKDGRLHSQFALANLTSSDQSDGSHSALSTSSSEYPVDDLVSAQTDGRTPALLAGAFTDAKRTASSVSDHGSRTPTPTPTAGRQHTRTRSNISPSKAGPNSAHTHRQPFITSVTSDISTYATPTAQLVSPTCSRLSLRRSVRVCLRDDFGVSQMMAVTEIAGTVMRPQEPPPLHPLEDVLSGKSVEVQSLHPVL